MSRTKVFSIRAVAGIATVAAGLMVGACGGGSGGGGDSPASGISGEQKRYLAFGSILLTLNGESCQTFKIRASKSEVKTVLNEWWGIENRNDARETANDLSTAGVHTSFADDVYNAFIKKGKLDPLSMNDLQDMAGLENAYKATLMRLFDSDDMSKPLAPKDQAAVKKAMLDRINKGLSSYKTEKKMLMKLGYTEEELVKISTMAAWDYGRTGFIARYSAHIGYLQEDEAWAYMKTAADNAAKSYADWREYLAAYVLGRAIAYGHGDLDRTVKYLLNDSKSPFKEAPFKP